MNGALGQVQELVTVLDSWPEVVGLLILGLVFLGWQIVKNTKATQVGNEATKRIEKTLTRNNGGSHVKDSLDRIEAGLAEVVQTVSAVDERLTQVEDSITKTE